MSGKTTLARRLARLHADNGRGVLVLDPLFDQELRRIADWSTDDPQEFLSVAWANENCTLIIDEGGQAIGRYGTLLEVLATQARHLGHMSIFISQRPVQLPLTLRDQCAWIAAFAIRRHDAERLADDFSDDALLQAPLFDKGQYVVCKPFTAPAYGHIFGGAPFAPGGRHETISGRPAGPDLLAAPVSTHLQPARRGAQGAHRKKRKP